MEYVPVSIHLWGIDTEIKVITGWQVSVDPSCLNKLGKILNKPIKLSARFGEYDALMHFLTGTGMNFLEMIDLKEVRFSKLIEDIYNATRYPDCEVACWGGSPNPPIRRKSAATHRSGA